MAIWDTLLKPALDSVTGIISQFHMSPEDKAKYDQQILQMQADLQKQSQDYEVKLNDIAGQNIRADSQNSDKFTARARPTFAYIIEFILAFNYIGIPIARMSGAHVDVIQLPGDLLTLFGVYMTGFVYMRSVDKTMTLPGESSVSGLSFKNTTPSQGGNNA
jgi:hypothetical protein